MEYVVFLTYLLREDAFTSIVALLMLVVTSWGIFKGGKMMERYYYERTLRALESFYPQLRQYLQEFESTIAKKDDEDNEHSYPFNKVFFALSKNANFSSCDYDKNDPKWRREICLVSDFSKEFLGFLRKNNNQVPDCEEQRRKKWRKKIKDLNKYLIILEGLRHDRTESTLSVSLEILSDEKGARDKKAKEDLVEKVTNYYENLNSLISEILDDITQYEDETLGQINNF